MTDLVTARLVLHPLDAVEGRRILAGLPSRGDRWARGYPFEGDVAAVTAFLRGGAPQPFGVYQIRAGGLAIGGIGFHAPPDEDDSVEVGYGLIPSARGRGYAREALCELLSIARSHGIVRVRGTTTRDNVASQHVMVAAGMLLVAEDDALKHYETGWA